MLKALVVIAASILPTAAFAEPWFGFDEGAFYGNGTKDGEAVLMLRCKDNQIALFYIAADDVSRFGLAEGSAVTTKVLLNQSVEHAFDSVWPQVAIGGDGARTIGRDIATANGNIVVTLEDAAGREVTRNNFSSVGSGAAVRPVLEKCR